MAHNSRFMGDAAWASAKLLPAAFLQALDTALSKTIDGNAGGSFTMAATATIGGAGLWLCAPSILQSGATLQTPFGSHKRVTLCTGDYMPLGATHPGRTRTIHSDVGAAAEACGRASLAVMGTALGLQNYTVDPANGAKARAGFRLLVPLTVHESSTLTQAVFWFRVGGNHSSVPARLPLFRAFRASLTGQLDPLKSATAITGGYVPFSPTPASGAAWYAGGAVQSFTYTCDQNNVIDGANYAYFGEIVDESGGTLGAQGGNEFLDVVCTFTNIADMRPY